MDGEPMISLAQYVAQEGGIATNDLALQGELDHVRYLNLALRGRNSVLRPSGRQLDVMAIDCIDAGYPITEGDCLEALEADARAWANKSSRSRVWVDFELSDDDLSLFDAEYESFLMERAQAPVCGACDSPTGTTITFDGEMLCAGCHTWATGLTGELEHHTSKPATELDAQASAALFAALTQFTLTLN